jgi:hypothetical protein
MPAAAANRSDMIDFSRWIAASSAIRLSFQQCASDARPNECRPGPCALIALPSVLGSLRFGRGFGRLVGFAAVNARSPRVGLLLHQAATFSRPAIQARTSVSLKATLRSDRRIGAGNSPAATFR